MDILYGVRMKKMTKNKKLSNLGFYKFLKKPSKITQGMKDRLSVESSQNKPDGLTTAEK